MDSIRDDPTLAQQSYSFLDIIGQTPTGFKINGVTLYAGSGVPSASLGQDGDYYFRQDGGIATHIYFKSGGAWAGII